jgi:hypothetical protein
MMRSMMVAGWMRQLSAAAAARRGVPAALAMRAPRPDRRPRDHRASRAAPAFASRLRLRFDGRRIGLRALGDFFAFLRTRARFRRFFSGRFAFGFAFAVDFSFGVAFACFAFRLPFGAPFRPFAPRRGAGAFAGGDGGGARVPLRGRGCLRGHLRRHGEREQEEERRGGEEGDGAPAPDLPPPAVPPPALALVVNRHGTSLNDRNRSHTTRRSRSN